MIIFTIIWWFDFDQDRPLSFIKSKLHHSICAEFISNLIPKIIDFNNQSCCKVFAFNCFQLNLKWTCMHLSQSQSPDHLILLVYILILNVIGCFWSSNHANFDRREMRMLIVYQRKKKFQNWHGDTELWSFLRKSLCFDVDKYLSIMADPRGQIAYEHFNNVTICSIWKKCQAWVKWYMRVLG